MYHVNKKLSDLHLSFFKLKLPFFYSLLSFLNLELRFLNLLLRFLNLKLRFLNLKLRFLNLKLRFLNLVLSFLNLKLRFLNLVLTFLNFKLRGSATQNLLIFQLCFTMLKMKLYVCRNLCENFRQIGQKMKKL